MGAQFRIVTTTPNGLCAELHHQMPVVLAPDAWLGAEAEPRQLKALLPSYRGCETREDFCHSWKT